MSLWYGQIRTFILEVFIEDIWQDAIISLIINITNLLSQKISSVGLCEKILHSNTFSCNKYSLCEKLLYLPTMSKNRFDHHQQQTFLTGRFPRGDKLWKKRFSQDFLAERIHV